MVDRGFRLQIWNVDVGKPFRYLIGPSVNWSRTGPFQDLGTENPLVVS